MKGVHGFFFVFMAELKRCSTFTCSLSKLRSLLNSPLIAAFLPISLSRLSIFYVPLQLYCSLKPQHNGAWILFSCLSFPLTVFLFSPICLFLMFILQFISSTFSQSLLKPVQCPVRSKVNSVSIIVPLCFHLQKWFSNTDKLMQDTVGTFQNG